MPVKHDLFADLHVSKEVFEKKKEADPRLSQLYDKYLAKDSEVLKAEDSAAADEVVNRLRVERLKLKDDISDHLKP
ncbi:hypothetical protein DCO48_05950 [Pseudomonas sp. SDI]|uniref:DUF465 domain-containing protein n=1 Tax=Pseudomonas sp. SDI TaxID=2170734 RepID=UPI000DE7A2D8|nr:DUF465 domain-containing protein [Pseudomonas sp. SDI]PWB34683.1 hypothetical protein DCO48_05950 [Pseudomonas sp. SDI]